MSTNSLQNNHTNNDKNNISITISNIPLSTSYSNIETNKDQGSIHSDHSRSSNLSSHEKDNNDNLNQGKVKRGLKPRHVSMIALGGTIGTGLFVGTGSALSSAGPLGTLISYIFMATVVYSLAQSLGEMATYIPVTGSFTVFCTRFISPALGASVGWLYWFSWATSYAIELSIVGQVIQYWSTAVPQAAWISIFLIAFSAMNFFPVKVYGEIEFWASSIKLIAIVGWLIYAFCMVCGAGAGTGPIGFRYWKDPGLWGPGNLIPGNTNSGRFLGWLFALVNAAFTYQGSELVGVSAGECANPRKSVPRAINRVFIRIVVFYIMSIFFMGLLVPFNDPHLSDTSQFISSSPFVIAILNSGTRVLDHIFNAVILTTILSAGNSNLYIGSRLLYALGSSNVGPKLLTRTTPSGVPYIGVVITAIFGCLSFLSVSNGSKNAFNWLVSMSTVAGLLTWAAISLCHLRFMRALQYHQISRDSLPFKAKGGRPYAWYSLICIIIIVIIQGFPSFLNFSLQDFLTSYISLFIFVILWLIFQFIVFRDTQIYKLPKDIDIFTDCIDDEDPIDENSNNNNNQEETPKLSKWEKLLDFIF